MKAGAGSGPVINVLGCANRLYLQHLGVMLVSMLANNPQHRFNLVVVAGDGASEERQKLEATIAPFASAQLRIQEFVPASALRLPTPAAYSADIYTRLWADEFFGPDVDRVLYLDADMVVLGDVGELWGQDLEGNLFGAVDIPGSTRPAELGMPEQYGYFNSGLLLIDLARWRKERALDRVLALIKARGAAFKDPDQDALNLCFCAERKPLAYKWNVITPFYRPSHDLRLSADTIAAVKRDARIVHYNGISRPWSYHSRHPRKPDYYKYLAQTAWRGFTPRDRTPLDIARKHLGPLLPASVKRLVKPLLG